MIVRPVGVPGFSTASYRRRVKMIPRVVHVRMAIPPTLPRLLVALFLIVDVEIVVAVPPDLETS